MTTRSKSIATIVVLAVASVSSVGRGGGSGPDDLVKLDGSISDSLKGSIASTGLLGDIEIEVAKKVAVVRLKKLGIKVIA